MITASHVRMQPPVQSGNTESVAGKYGYTGAVTPEQITAARTFAEELATTIDRRIDQHFSRLIFDRREPLQFF